jgi:hypothetical protein
LPAGVEESQSSLLSRPVLTTGKYLYEYPKKSNFFDAMMFVYHGFSGGPVMHKEKLIGIVSGGAYSEMVLTGNRLPFQYLIYNHSKFIKSSAIYSIIKQMRIKLKNIAKNDKIYLGP